MFNPGQEIELVYPTMTDILHINLSPRRVRQLRVHRVRDLVRDPLTPAEYAHRPYVARSRWLVLASEFAGERPKQFYAGSADNYRSPGTLRLALYKHGATQPHMLLGRQFEPTPKDRRMLLRLINQEIEKYPRFDLRVIACDMRLHA